MSRRKLSDTRKRMLAATERKVAAQAAIWECLSNRSRGSDMVVRLMEARYELQLAKSEVFQAMLADAQWMLGDD